jgi:hypothetical protein
MPTMTVYIKDDLWEACLAVKGTLNKSRLIQAALISWLEVTDPIASDILRLSPKERTTELIKVERERLH